MASCGGDKAIRVWGQSRLSGAWTCLATLDDGQQRTIRSLAWSPCARFIASVSFDATTAIWEHVAVEDEASGSGDGEMRWELAVQLEGHENEVKGVCWNPEGSLLATCGRDKSIWIWDVVDLAGSNFECLSVLQEHSQVRRTC
jgi:WD40 repeat protein